jgi:hypothetical protein
MNTLDEEASGKPFFLNYTPLNPAIMLMIVTDNLQVIW